MIKVMIVDDEPKVREGLTKLIPWDSYDYTVVGTAANGFEALEKFNELQPNLVVADIRMPGMDGIQLIEKLREQDDKLHILILSGYADFDYAKKAIASRADGYLLKPVDEEELISYLERIRQKWQEENEQQKWTDSALNLNRERIVKSLLTGTREEAAALLSSAVSLGLSSKEYQILLLDLYVCEGENHAVLGEAAERLQDYFEQMNLGVAFKLYSHTGILLNKPFVGLQMRQQLTRDLDGVLGGMSVKFTASLGQVVRSLTEISHSYHDAKELLDCEFFCAEEGVMYREMNAKTDPGRSEDIDLTSIEEQMYYALDLGNPDPLPDLVKTAGEYLTNEGRTEQEIKRYFAELITGLISKLSARNPDLDGILKLYTERIAHLYQKRSLYLLTRHAAEILQTVTSHIDRCQHQDVKIMLDMIHRNYGDNLKLETLAGVLNYNNAYLGKLFKNATGEYFNTYLDKVRIEQAKRMLQEGMKVYQVAEKVGYTNADYFHSKFKRYVGTSPSVYRKQGEEAGKHQISI
ncbi:putative response regulatory protein [compost metagenome]